VILSAGTSGDVRVTLILDGYLITVDTLDVHHGKLAGQIVVAWNVEKGLIVSRLMRFDHTDVLVSDRREYESISLPRNPSGALLARFCGGQVGRDTDNCC
jgi:hypothetical protein